MRVVPAAVAAPLVILLLTWLSIGAVNPDEERCDRALQALDAFAMSESLLEQDVLAARAGILRNYDPIVRETQAIDGALERLGSSRWSDRATAAATAQLAASVERQEDLIERFKSNNALLQNSLAYFVLSSGRLEASARTRPLVPAAGALSAAMLRLTLDASPANADDVDGRLGALARRAHASGDDTQVQALLAHGRMLRELLPATDSVLKALSALPQMRRQEAVRAMIAARQLRSRKTARQFRFMLYLTSLLLLGLLTQLGLRLRARGRALRARAAFEHVIANASMRFINARPKRTAALIEQALAEMAQCLGADRAYFLVPGPATRIHTWGRAGTAFPTDWPAQAATLVAQAKRTAEGVAYVPCLGSGLAGWTCASNIGENGVGGILGFDGLQGSCADARSGQLSLLRMALDTLTHAVDRERLEGERGRYQQARRMEAIGVLASGIAHNFNNITGAILGYTEIIEARVEPGSWLGRNVGEIRRSGERARDLVDHILTFGRPRDLRRTALGVGTLVREAKALLQASLPSRIELIVHEPPEEAIVSGELAQLQQVILNLCNNAAQAIDTAGRIEVEADVRDIATGTPLSHGHLPVGRYVRICVADAGRGMDRPTLDRLFEPFFTTRPDGHGLGLATVREIIREHGGAIDVRSTPGLGSRFEVWLPCVVAGSADLALHALPVGRGETVLVVDEDHERLIKNEEMLAALCYEPVGFSRAGDALAACRVAPERFDAIVIGDAATAGVIEVAAGLRRLAPALPIVLMAAPADDLDMAALAAAGVSDFVHGPLSSPELIGALARRLAALTSQPRRD
jgi:signal transduction histidine kinase